MIVEHAKIQSALEYLAETDVSYAEARSRLKGLEYRIKTVKALAQLSADGKTVSEREAQALSSESFQEITEQYENAVLDAETIGAKRKRAELLVEVWRTENANRRVGNVS